MAVRFTIRDLLWLAAVAALAVGWRLEHVKLKEETDSVIEAARRENGNQLARIAQLQQTISGLTQCLTRNRVQDISSDESPIDSMPILRPRNRDSRPSPSLSGR